VCAAESYLVVAVWRLASEGGGAQWADRWRPWATGRVRPIAMKRTEKVSLLAGQLLA